MLEILIPKAILYDEKNNKVINLEEKKICLEHSLVSIHKWEMMYEKPFFSKDNKTQKEFIDYIKCMTLTQNVKDEYYSNINNSLLKQIKEYMEKKMTATWISDENKKAPARRVITSEVIYSWMFQLNIPLECQKWHFNTLMMLIRVCGEETSPKKQMKKSDILKQQHALNVARRKR